MLPQHANIGVIIGHPGHELRIYRMLELYHPRLYVLTDGSRLTHHARTYNTIRIIEQTDSKQSNILGRFTDVEMYKIFLTGDTATLKALVDELVDDLILHQIEILIGDAVEGYNPTHDLCRYLINSAAQIISHKRGTPVLNYDFLLHGRPDLNLGDLAGECIQFQLDDENFEKKYTAATNYPELKRDLDLTIALHGTSPFKIESLRPVKDYSKYISWDTDFPFYETYGRKKIDAGDYTELISFESHILPLAKYLSDYAQDVSRQV